MPRARRTRATIAAVAALAALAAVPSLAAPSRARVAPAFAAPVRLPVYAGGEPSIVADDKGGVFVVAPQGLPAALGAVTEAPARSGVALWASYDGGRTFNHRLVAGSALGGADADIEIGSDGTIYLADLQLAATAICLSRNSARSFQSSALVDDGCADVTTNHHGPESDRQWLSAGREDELYLTYHDLATGLPVILRSDNQAQTFTPCGTILDPLGEVAARYSPVGGTLVADPAVDSDGSLFVAVTTPEPNVTTFDAPLTTITMAVADGGCGATVFRNHTVFRNPNADLGKMFNVSAVDAGGTVYVVAAGKTSKHQRTTNVWLFSSRDGGRTWSKPTRVNTPDLTANVLPAVVGGLGRDQVAIGWFGASTHYDPDYPKHHWRFYVSTSFDAGRTFHQSAVTRDPVHYGDICTRGIFCGVVRGQPNTTGAVAPGLQPGNRNLADFASMAVDPRTGCVLVAFPGDPWNRPDLKEPHSYSASAYVARQVGGRCLAARSPRR